MESISQKFRHECESWIATLEVLSDKELTARLLKVAETVDDDIAHGRLLSMEEVFPEEVKE